ncbi:ribonuclease domain-containing protein [Streptomyces sp. NPDC001356]
MSRSNTASGRALLSVTPATLTSPGPVRGRATGGATPVGPYGAYPRTHRAWPRESRAPSGVEPWCEQHSDQPDPVLRPRPLPHPRGYHEYTVITPGSPTRGARRIVTGDEDREDYCTSDHYATSDLVDFGC